MIVDNLKSCYRTLMRIRLDPEVIVPVRWYFAPDGAEVLPIETAFGSSVWETDDREYPQPGLGEVSLTRQWDNGRPPLGVTGHGTRTPLEWFRDGLPADAVYPPPNAASSVRIDERREVSCVAGDVALLTDEGALAQLVEDLPAIRRWKFLLFVWPAALGDDTTAADLIEASFPGYTRATPDWTAPVLSGPQQATTYATPLAWTRAAGSAPAQTVFGWAAVAAGAPVQLRAVQLLPTPITFAIAGDNVTLCPIQLLLGLCLAPAPVQLGTGGEADGGTAVQTTAPVQLGLGGEADGGKAVQTIPLAQAGLGGEADGGTADQVVGSVQLGTGGEADGGTADQVVGSVQLGTGGEADGGTADQVVVTAYSLDFDSTGYVAVSSWAAPSALSLSLWLKPADYDSRTQFLLGWANSLGNVITSLYCYLGQLRIVADSGGGNAGYWAVLAPDLSNGVWSLLVVTQADPSSLPVVTIDGTDQTVTELLLIGSPSRATQPFALGRAGAQSGSMYAGLLHEVAVYDSVLDGAAKAALLAGGNPEDYSPVAFYKTGEGAGTSVGDSTGNGHDGTISGGVTWSTDVP